mgnify:CR=1 FL=1
MANQTLAASALNKTGTIIHLGAGRCRELPDYLACDPERIVLVEAHPGWADRLRRQTADHPNVEVAAQAVASPNNAPNLKVLNLKALSSLRSPTGLYDLFPGLRITEEIEVDRVPPETFLQGQGLEPGQGNWLIVDAPGEEEAILQALEQSDHFPAFSRIDLHCGRTPLYESNSHSEELLQRFAELGYETAECVEETDPDRPRWTLRYNTLKAENLELKARLREQSDKAEAFQAQVAEVAGERDEQAKLAEERRQEKEKLASEVADRDRRLHLTNEEIAKSEAQIDLLKELLVHESRT